MTIARGVVFNCRLYLKALCCTERAMEIEKFIKISSLGGSLRVTLIYEQKA